MKLKRTKPDANLYRFCNLAIMPCLFGGWGLMGNWGCIGNAGQLRTELFESEATAKDGHFEPHIQEAKRRYE